MKENKILSDLSSRFLDVIAKKGYSNYKISKEIDLFTEAKLSHIKRGRNQPSDDLIESLMNKFPDVNKVWLLTGEGQMLSSDIKPRLEAIPMRLADPYGYESTGEKIYELNDGSLMMEVPIVPIKAYAGYLRGYGDREFYEDLATIPVMIEKRAFSTYMAFEISGDSMVNLSTYEFAEKSIFPGRIAVGRLLDQSKWQYKLHTHNYDAWIIVHKTKGILCKTIINHDVDNAVITIHSLNPEYEDEDLHLRDIDQIFSIIKVDQNKR